MRSATLILGLFLAATSAAIPMPRRATEAVSGLNRRDSFVTRGEEATADEDVTWNAELYPAGTGERRSIFDVRGEEESADEDVTWNVDVYREGPERRSVLDARGEEEIADEDVTWNVSVYEESSFVVSVVLPALAILATSLRFVAQRHISVLRTADDILVAVNCVILVGSGCLTIVGATVGGIGADLAEVDADTIVRFRKIAFVSEFFYIFTVGIVKLSLLLYYRRIFVLSLVSRGFRRLNDVLIAVVGLWILAFFITTFLQARPISWNWTEVGSVSNLHDFFISEAVTNIALDLIVLCMPMLIMYQMRMSLRKKIFVVGIFGLGFFCVIASAIRLYYVTKFFAVSIQVHPKQFEETVANLDLWSLIEPCSSTICICLPCLGPLFRGGHSASSLVNSVRAIFSLGSDSSSQGQGEGNQLPDMQDSVKLHNLQASKPLGQVDGQSQNNIYHAKANEISDLEGRGVRVVSNE